MKFFANNADYYDALRGIALSQTVEQLRRKSEKEYGLDFHEALEFSYENIQQVAKRALKGKRRPNVAIGIVVVKDKER